MASEKRCHYEVLGVSKDSSADEIRAAYKKLALQRHPDKLVQSGLSQADATALFQELLLAYEVLSDPKERAWYDSHRSQILFSDVNSSSFSSASAVPNLFSFFSNAAFSGYSDSGKGFYKVFSDAFDRIYSAEIGFVKKLGLGLDTVREAPLMGNLESPYSQVTAFYNYWLGFSTVMDFCWVDRYDAMGGPNRRSRRFFEEENKKLRRKARREYNETVRELAAFVKKRDKRVIDMLVRKSEERERKREEERERKKRLERERLERASRYEEPEWVRVNDEDDTGDDGIEEEGSEEKKRDEEFYCVACGKKFKSEKQWKNHERSKKHKEKVAELRESFEEEEEEEWEGCEGVDGEVVEELGEVVKEGLGMEEERDVEDMVGGLSGEEEEEEENDVFLGVDDENEVDGDEDGFVDEDEDEEMSMLKAMVSGHKSRKKVDLRQKNEVLQTEVYAENGIEDGEPMEYDNHKSTRRKNKKEKGRKNNGEAVKGDKSGTKDKDEEEANGHDDSHMEEKSSSYAFVQNQTNGVRDDHSGKNVKIANQPIGGEGAMKDKKARLKNSSKGKKTKAMSKNSGNVCEKCGEEFESRNRLHKHLGDTGHATLKSR